MTHKYLLTLGKISSAFFTMMLIGASFAEDLTKSDIKLLQQNLNQIGFSVGAADGIPGRRTISAIKQLNFNYAGLDDASVTEDVLNLSNMIIANRSNEPQAPVENTIFTWERDAIRIDLSKHRNPCKPENRCEPMSIPLAALDFDLDGDNDLVYGTYYFVNGKNVRSGKPLILLENDGHGRFSELAGKVELDLVHVREALVADFDGDGFDDLFLLDHGMDARPFPGAQNALILSRPNGPVDVTEQSLPSRADFSHGGAAGDLDGDGDIDILVIANESQVVKHNSYVLENDGNGSFSINDRPDYIDFGLLDIRSRGNDYSLNNSAKIVDFDQDGSLDIAWLASGDGAKTAAQKSGAQFTHITYGDGSYRYLSTNTFDLPLARWGHNTFVTDLKHVDFDGDGDLDLIATSNTRKGLGPWRGAYLDVLENIGQRVYRNVTHKHVFSQGYPNLEDKMWNHWVYPIDFNNDGAVDVAVMSLDPLQKKRGSLEETTVKIAMQGDNEVLLPLSNSGISSKEYTLRKLLPTDVDGDGDIDLVGSRLLKSFEYKSDDPVFVGFILQVVTNRTIN